MMVCREMQERDLPRVAELERENFSMPWSEASLLKEISNTNSIFMVAEYKGNIAGYAGMYLIAPEGDITNVAVASLYRRKGIASALLESVMNYAKAAGILEITLEVRAGNTPAIKLYEKYGFASEGIRPGFYEFPKEDAIIMWNRDIK